MLAVACLVCLKRSPNFSLFCFFALSLGGGWERLGRGGMAPQLT